jgi:hypothetical protein
MSFSGRRQPPARAEAAAANGPRRRSSLTDIVKSVMKRVKTFLDAQIPEAQVPEDRPSRRSVDPWSTRAKQFVKAALSRKHEISTAVSVMA